MKHIFVRVSTLLGVVGALVLVPALSASAHVTKNFGPVHIEMGFGTEPAYAGQPNSVYMGIQKNGKPVVDLTDTLKVNVSYGTESVDLPLVPNFVVGGDGTPGDYRAWFIPSQGGPYTFHITGTVDGTKVDWTESSSPSTFDAIQAPADASFPKVSTLTSQQLSDLISNQTTRLQSSIDNANSAAKSARTAAVIGIVLGALGLGIGVVAITRKRI
jgi:hypothetical protein